MEKKLLDTLILNYQDKESTNYGVVVCHTCKYLLNR